MYDLLEIIECYFYAYILLCEYYLTPSGRLVDRLTISKNGLNV